MDIISCGDVGYHNLIIADCGSSDPAFIDFLDSIKNKVLILKYHKYYDILHSVRQNQSFYTFIAKNCKYLAILDADEYLFGCYNNLILKHSIVSVINELNLDFYAGTWFNNIYPPTTFGNFINWSQPLAFDFSDQAIAHGTLQGKSIIKSSCILSLSHIGHNLSVFDVVKLATPASFGVVGIFHVKILGRSLTQARIVKHLYSKGALPRNLVDENDIHLYLKNQLENNQLGATEKIYVNRYFSAQKEPQLSERYFSSLIIAGAEEENNEAFSLAFKNFNFGELLRSRFEELSSKQS